MKVTVHFFKPSGKWYTTEECEWTGQAQEHMNKGNWRGAIRCITPHERLSEMFAVVVDSPLGFPGMISVTGPPYLAGA